MNRSASAGDELKPASPTLPGQSCLAVGSRRTGGARVFRRLAVRAVQRIGAQLPELESGAARPKDASLSLMLSRVPRLKESPCPSP